MKMNFEKIVAIAIVLVVVVSAVVLYGLANKDTTVEGEPAPEVSESEPAPVEESEPEAEAAPAPAGEPDKQADVNVNAGGGDIPLDENGTYVGGTGGDPANPEAIVEPVEEEPVEKEQEEEPEEEPVANTEYGYNSFDEIDTSKLEIGQPVIVQGKKYTWFGPLADDPSGFMEVRSNNGAHIDMNEGPLSGNIIGY